MNCNAIAIAKFRPERYPAGGGRLLGRIALAFFAAWACMAGQAMAQRVTNGLQVLYTFQEGSGTTVRDVSGVGTALDLTIRDPGNVTWIPGGGLSINSETHLRSGVPATKVIAACKASNEVTIEAWVKPANLTQAGPARIIGISEAEGHRPLPTADISATFFLPRVPPRQTETTWSDCDRAQARPPTFSTGCLTLFRPQMLLHSI